MAMDVDEMTELKAELRRLMVDQGKSAIIAYEIVRIAALAAREATQQIVEVVSNAPEDQRDVAIVLALNIMERLTLSGFDSRKTRH